MTEITDHLVDLTPSLGQDCSQSLATSRLLNLASGLGGPHAKSNQSESTTLRATETAELSSVMAADRTPISNPSTVASEPRPKTGDDVEPSLRIPRGRVWTAAIRLMSDHPLDFEEERKRILVGFLTVMSSAMLLVFGISHLFTGRKIEGIVDISVVAVLALGLKLLRSRTDGRLFYQSFAILFGLLFIFLGFLGEGTESRILWVFTYPAFACFLAGIRMGSLTAAFVCAAWTALLVIPPTWTGAASYSDSVAPRFIGSYVTIFFMAMFLEQVRRKYFDAMIQAQQRLNQDKVALAAAEQRMREMALEDELTGIPNRRSILAQLESEIVVSRRSGGPISVALLDIDHFKHVNDTYGHPAGDRVLVEVASRISGTIRARDSVGRCGGEEFLLLLPETSRDAALEVLERVRRALADLPIDAEGSAVSITASIGMTTAAGKRVDLAPLIRATDEALYQAKDSGRNRVCSQRSA